MKDIKKIKLLVIDSSVALKWVNSQQEKFINKAEKIIKNAQNKNIHLVMPELGKYEIGNALLYKKLPLEQYQTALVDFYTIPIQFVPEDEQLAQSTAEIAYKNNITYYDATFMALARKLRADLITDNPKHQRRKVVGLKIVALKDYR